MRTNRSCAGASPHIGPRSFRWRAESSRDGGATWEFDEEMLATRVGVT